MEDLANIWSNLSLTEKENTSLKLQQDQRSREFIIATKFLATHFFNMEAMVRTSKQLWHSMNEFKIRNLGDH